MRKKIGWILIAVTVAGLIFSFSVELYQPECCTCGRPISAGAKLGLGATLLWSKRVIVECMCVDTVGCRAQYSIIPVDFIILSLIIGAVGVNLFRKNIPGNLGGINK